ncbi:hypothetical protein [Chryseolinea lacunae]|uniref:Glycine zipper family protein n=1 Tax=Chryseolinea lacunae TaxID=2801331 RepID=A0ABS1KTL0_9BACT|nr:hypothetical protein [Chryseolinea lacunae]MBL0742795.1 hypothetical protein [Chryseolinea lacunae]
MKNMESMVPVFADVISGAFGGAVIGNAIGGNTIPIVGAIAGAMFMLFHALFTQRQKKAR